MNIIFTPVRRGGRRRVVGEKDCKIVMILDEAKRKNKPCIVFKVDYKKAYDSVSWDFLLYMLKRMSFCSRWILWIEGCLKFTSVSVLVNGSPT